MFEKLEIFVPSVGIILLFFQCSFVYSEDEVKKLDQVENYIVKVKDPDVYQGKENIGVAILGAVIEVSHQRGPWRFSKSLNGWIHVKNLVLLKDSIKEFTANLDSDPNPTGYHLRGIAYMAQENWGRAVNDLEEAYKLGDSSVTLHINLGTSLLNLGLVEKAKLEFTAVIENFPDEAVAYQSRGDLYLDIGEYDAALADLRKAAELKPKSSETYNSIGIALRLQGEYHEAILAYNKSIEFDQKYMSGYLNRAYAYKNIGEFSKSVADYQTALKLEPASPSIKNDLAWLLATCEDETFIDGDESLKLALESCSAVDYRKPEYVDTLAAAYARVGNFKKAVETAQTAGELFQDEADRQDCLKRLELYRKNMAFVEKVAGK